MYTVTENQIAAMNYNEIRDIVARMDYRGNRAGGRGRSHRIEFFGLVCPDWTECDGKITLGDVPAGHSVIKVDGWFCVLALRPCGTLTLVFAVSEDELLAFTASL